MSFYKEAASRLIKEFWKLSPEARAATHAAGMHRGADVYAKGIATGNDSIANKLGVTYVEGKTPTTKPYSVIGGDKKFRFDVVKSKAKNDMTRAIVDRHELLEAKELSNQMSQKYKGYATGKVPAQLRMSRSRGDKNRKIKEMIFPSGNITSTSHANYGVLARESNLLSKIPYDNAVRKYRVGSGEADIMKDLTGKRYGVDSMSPSKLNKSDKGGMYINDYELPEGQSYLKRIASSILNTRSLLK
jgi:hypothetical protein